VGSTSRKVMLTLHVMASVGWAGAAAAFLTLAVVAATTADEVLARAALRVMEPATNFVIVPLALVALGTGVAQALATPWGLLRHYWVVIKLLLTVFAVVVLVDYASTASAVTAQAADPTMTATQLRDLTVGPIIHAAGGLIILTTTTALSVFKPRGLTRRGQRAQRQAKRR
jgi:hypothetical protein